MENMKLKLIAKIKLIHKIPPDDELNVENEVFLDYFSTELLKWVEENTDDLKWKNDDGDK